MSLSTSLSSMSLNEGSPTPSVAGTPIRSRPYDTTPTKQRAPLSPLTKTPTPQSPIAIHFTSENYNASNTMKEKEGETPKKPEWNDSVAVKVTPKRVAWTGEIRMRNEAGKSAASQEDQIKALRLRLDEAKVEKKQMESKLNAESKAKLNAEMELQLVSGKLTETENKLKEAKKTIADVQTAATKREAELEKQLSTEINMRKRLELQVSNIKTE